MSQLVCKAARWTGLLLITAVAVIGPAVTSSADGAESGNIHSKLFGGTGAHWSLGQGQDAFAAKEREARLIRQNIKSYISQLAAAAEKQQYVHKPNRIKNRKLRKIRMRKAKKRRRLKRRIKRHRYLPYKYRDDRLLPHLRPPVHQVPWFEIRG